MQTHNQERFNKLQSLSPSETVQAWLDGKFGMGDEPAMISAIRRDTRILLSDNDITKVICNALDEGWDASTCLERMAAAK